MDVEDLWFVRDRDENNERRFLDILRLSVLPSGFVTVAKAAAEPPDTNCVPPV